MGRYDDIHPDDIDPDTGRPYAGYSSPALDTTFHDHEMDVEDSAASQVFELLKAWKCNCTDGFYLQRSRDMPRARGVGVWIPCVRCGGSGRDPRATEAMAILAADLALDMLEDDDSYPPRCTSRGGHRWVCDDTDEERTYCENCGADGNA